MLISKDSFQIGGGEGIGLYLDSELWHGKTSRCTTFCNEPLTSTTFESVALELYTCK